MGSQLGSVLLEETVDKVDHGERVLRAASRVSPRDARDESPPHIFVVDPDEAEGTELASYILETRERDLLVSVATDAATLDVDCAGRMFSADLVLLRLGTSAGDGIANAIALTERAPWISPIFWVSHAESCLELRIAKALGLARVLARENLLPWLHEAAYPMARLARARRATWEAERALPPIPARAAFDEGALTPLPRAEQSFREAYLRSLLAHTTNRREAAERAGVPYTTLVSMLKKFGLSR
jgi:DNA-binding NtrC family response regulator